MEVNVHQAKTHLSRLLQRVAGGEEITIARAGVPVAKLVAINTRAAARPLGMDFVDGSPYRKILTLRCPTRC